MECVWYILICQAIQSFEQVYILYLYFTFLKNVELAVLVGTD